MLSTVTRNLSLPFEGVLWIYLSFVGHVSSPHDTKCIKCQFFLLQIWVFFGRQCTLWCGLRSPYSRWIIIMISSNVIYHIFIYSRWIIMSSIQCHIFIYSQWESYWNIILNAFIIIINHSVSSMFEIFCLFTSLAWEVVFITYDYNII